MIYIELSRNEIADALMNDVYGGWSYDEAYELADFLEEEADSMGEDMELDVTAIRGDWTGYDSLEELQEQYEGLEEAEDLEDAAAILHNDRDFSTIVVRNKSILVREY